MRKLSEGEGSPAVAGQGRIVATATNIPQQHLIIVSSHAGQEPAIWAEGEAGDPVGVSGERLANLSLRLDIPEPHGTVPVAAG